ncbi:metallophosphoesterase family protein [Ktedonospora formicarum]|uniref:Metallophosphoesterase n=1 Tax=Ktedonospora formicarum TaxID=2778364 RepID=A0A8J3MVC5_9CHLR|nr:metallophosphoesterase family protein [Ktedonospora formicarum]GHO47801.1 metallophosphoesterase [Ktedonospora formicarum]
MRIALLSDIHGNSVALDAVLAALREEGGIDAYWVLGDLVALGHDPVGVLERLSQLPNLRCTRGNTDRYVVTGDRPPPTREQVQEDIALLPIFKEVAETFAWTQGAITAKGWLEWLTNLPLELREELPDGTRFLGVHAAPGKDDGTGIHDDLSPDEIGALLIECQAELVCVGHTHRPMQIVVQGKHVVNLGSVGLALPPDVRASYVLLSAEASGYSIEHKRVDYPRQEAIAALKERRHPGASFIIKHLQGS